MFFRRESFINTYTIVFMAGYTKVMSPSRFLKNSNNNLDFIKNKKDEKIHVRYPKQTKYKNKVHQSSTYSKNKVFFY